MLQELTTPNTASEGTLRMSRRTFNRWLLMGAAFATANAVVQGCSPIKYLTGAYPAKFSKNANLRDRLLHAFVHTVVPGADTSSPDAIRIFYDEYYPFYKYTAFFLDDLTSRTRVLFRTEDFASLEQARREQVLIAGLHADATIAKLYRAAIFATKAAIYGGIYDDDLGCPHIDFHGAWYVVPNDISYPDASNYLARAITNNGNPQ